MNPHLSPVLIRSVGVTSAVGLDATATAAAVRAGIARFEEHEFLVDANGDSVKVAASPAADDAFHPRERMLRLAIDAAREALNDKSSTGLQQPIPLLLAVPDARPGLAAEDIDWLAVELRTALAAEGRDVQPRLMRGGHAGGLLALQRCWTVFASGRAQAALIGGVDCWIDADTIDWLEGEERLFTPSNPHGFIPGEAAAFCLVTAPPADAAHARGAVPINGIATATEDVPRGGEQPNLGHGLTTAIGDALRRLPPTQRVTDILCDFNGEMERADEYSFVCVRLGERFVDATMTRTPADCWGDVGAATGPLLLALAYEGTRQNWLNGEHILVWCSADTRHRAAALLGTPVI